MTAPLTRQQAEELLYREALLLDTRQFGEWLTLFAPDVEFWMPAWRSETALTSDPDRELSLIYYKGIRNLEDRVNRLNSGLSTASTPAARCSHSVTNVVVQESSEKCATVAAVFTCHRYDARMNRQECFFGRYEYELCADADQWKIAGKKIVLLNDVIPTVVDIDSI